MALRYLLLAGVGLLISLGFTYSLAVQSGDPFRQDFWPFWAIAALVGVYAPIRLYQLWRWSQARADANPVKSRLETRMEARRARVAAAKARAESGASAVEPAVYALGFIEIHDRDRYADYEAGFMDVLGQFRGRLLAADDAAEAIEGDWDGRRVVVLAFPDRRAFQTWYESDAYRAILQHRQAAAASVVLLAKQPTPPKSD
ncbi:MAG: DUF1330 domain-containing protein [Pseudomonadota bacterium]